MSLADPMPVTSRPRRAAPPPPVPAGRRVDVAVVGAGPGGLAAAMLLASAGATVTVYEALDRVGGRTRRLETGPYRFDCGPTFFMMPYVLEEIFAATGRRLGDSVELTRLDPMYRLLLGRPGAAPLTIDTTQDLAAMAARLDAVRPGSGEAFHRFMRQNRTKLARMTPLLKRPVRSVMDLLSREALTAAPVLRPWKTLARYLEDFFPDPLVRLALSFQSKYLGMSPFECPELFSILPFIEYEYGIWHPRGGCSALVQAMADAAVESGVRIHTSSPVERIHFEGRRAVGVEVAGALHRHQHVVVNADATWALRTLVPPALRTGRRGANPWSDERIDAARYSCSTFMLYLGLDGAVELPHHTIHTSPTYERNLADISRNGTLSPDPSMYVCNPSRLDPTLAPAGHSALYVLVPVPNAKPGFSRVDWAAEGPRLRATAIEQLERVFQVPDVGRRIRAEICITPEDWRAERINHGATFNMAHTLGQMLHRRPQHRAEGLDGLWFVGGGTHPGSGLPVIFLSAGTTTRLLCEESGLQHPFLRVPASASPPPVSSVT